MPELAEVRDEVIAAWKQQKARELAKTAAEEFAAKVGTKSLDEVAGSAHTVLKPKSFAYFTMLSSILFQQGRSRDLEFEVIDGIEDETTDAVKDKVISLPVGKVAVVPNQGKQVYYVAKVVSETVDDEKRRESFLQDIVDNGVATGLPPAWQAMANDEHFRVFRDWYQQVQDEMDVEWPNAEFRARTLQGG